MISSVENTVNPLHECHAEDEFHAICLVLFSNLVYGQVNGVFLGAVEGDAVHAAQNLSIRSQFKRLVTDGKVERLEVPVLRGGNAEEASFTVIYRTGGSDVLGKSA